MDLFVFDEDYAPLGILSSPVSFSYIERVRSQGEFSLYLPLNSKNVELIKEDRIILFDKENGIAGIIGKMRKNTDSDDSPLLQVFGGLCDEYMYRRICWGMYSKNGKPSVIIEDMINTQITNPTKTERAIPDFVVDPSEFADESDITYQSTGGNVGDNVDAICSTNKMFRRVKYDPIAKKMFFKLFKGIDRTVSQKDVPPCVFSQIFENILQSEYEKDLTDSKNVGLVGGEEQENKQRVFVEVGDKTGKQRREMFIDARSVRSKQSDGTTLDDGQYKALLIQKADEKMAKVKEVESFDCVVNIMGNVQYNKDYFLGDFVTFKDALLGIEVNAEITEIEIVWDSNGKTIYITFGFGALTLSEKIKAKGVQ